MMIVTRNLSRRRLMGAGGGLLSTGIIPVADNMCDWGRSLKGRGADRLDRAEEFFRGLSAGVYRDERDLLYQAGIVSQLGIGAYLLELGASDDWCRRRIGLFVDKGLSIANEAGLDHRSPDMERLARLWSPYGRWHAPFVSDLPDLGGIAHGDLTKTVAELLGTVRRRMKNRRAESGKLPGELDIGSQVDVKCCFGST